MREKAEGALWSSMLAQEETQRILSMGVAGLICGEANEMLAYFRRPPHPANGRAYGLGFVMSCRTVFFREASFGLDLVGILPLR